MERLVIEKASPSSRGREAPSPFGTVDGAVLVLESLPGPAGLISKAQAKSLLWDWPGLVFISYSLGPMSINYSIHNKHVHLLYL